MAELFVGIDVGTTSVKVAVVDGGGQEVAHGSAPLVWDTADGLTELPPQRFTETALRAVESALRAAPAGPIAGIGVTSMAETGVLLDAEGRPIGPAIAWHDPRGADEIAWVGEQLGVDTFVRTAGVELRPLVSVAKHLWTLANIDGARDAVRRLNVAEWVVWSLGGHPGAELSLASRTGWLDVPAKRWWGAAMGLSGVSEELLGELVPAGVPAGRVTTGPERIRGAVLTVCGHDHLCGALGVGAVADGAVFDSCGTAEAFIAPLAPPVDSDQMAALVADGVHVGWHVIPDRHALLSSLRSGLHLRRFLALLGVDPADEAARRDLDAAALAQPPGAGGITVSGFATSAAAVTGIGSDPTPGQVWRAALEAMTVGSHERLTALEAATGPTREVFVGGGWARSEAVREVKRLGLGVISHPPVTEPGGRGAALLAGIAAGHHGGVHDLPQPRPHVGQPEVAS